MYDPEKITYFAETDSRNRRMPFGIKAKDRLKHVYVIGKTGMGKSTLLENMAVQDIQGGEGMCFIDPHGKTAELLLEYVPPERLEDVIYFAPFDVEHPISFNVMEDVGEDKRHLVANGLMSAFKKIWVDAWSARMEYILTNTILALLEYPDSTLISINRMLADKEYRKKVVDNITDPSVKAFWVDEFAKYTDKFAAEATPAIQNKVGQFTSNPLIRNIIGQPKSSFDLRKHMDEGKIIIVNLSKGRVGEANANLLGAMFITKIYLAAMSRADQSEAQLNKLPNFYLYVDEFQSFANESFANILSEARKYKLNLTIAHQYIEQMSEEVRAAVFGNVGTMITFRVGAYDAEVLEKEFAPIFTAEDLVNLGSFQIYLKLMIDGISSQPFSATTLPPIKKPDVSLVDKVIDNSRKIYAKPRAIVEKAIREWHEEGRAPEVRPARTRDASGAGGAPRVERREGDARQEDRRGPKPIDIRGQRKSFDKAPDRTQDRPFDKAQGRPFDKAQGREEMKKLPNDEEGFKPLSAIVIKDLEKKKDNQRKPSPENMNDLRSVLANLVKTEPKSPASTTAHTTPKQVEKPVPAKEPEKPKKEVSPEELKSIFGAE